MWQVSSAIYPTSTTFLVAPVTVCYCDLPGPRESVNKFKMKRTGNLSGFLNVNFIVLRTERNAWVFAIYFTFIHGAHSPNLSLAALQKDSQAPTRWDKGPFPRRRTTFQARLFRDISSYVFQIRPKKFSLTQFFRRNECKINLDLVLPHMSLRGARWKTFWRVRRDKSYFKNL